MMLAFVGSRTTRERHARGDGISVYRVDPEAGTLQLLHVTGGLVNPSYLALNAAGDRLYVVHGDTEEASAFKVDAEGRLALMGSVPCGGRNPVHLALDPTGSHLIVSNHLSSNVAVLTIGAEGELGPVAQTVELPGQPGPHRVEQPYAKPHFNPFDPSGRHVIVPDKGLNRIFAFRFEDGRLTPAATPWVDTRETAGPRHIAFHPTAPYAYAINELDSTMTAYRYDNETGRLDAFQLLSALSDTWTGNSRASGIVIDAAGRTLYASNRAHDSIAVFAIDRESGRLTFIEATPSGGRTPRFFALAPDGRHMFVLNEDSDAIRTFAVDAASGRLTDTGLSVGCGSPVCMVFSGG